MTIKRIENVLNGTGVVRDERQTLYVAAEPRGKADGSSPENAMAWEKPEHGCREFRNMRFDMDYTQFGIDYTGTAKQIHPVVLSTRDGKIVIELLKNPPELTKGLRKAIEAKYK